MARTRAEIEAEAEANRRRLLATEAAALLLLRGRLDETVAHGLRRGHTPVRIAHAIGGELRPVIAASRVTARNAAIVRLGIELESVGATRGSVPHDVARDVVRADAASKSFGSRWLRKAQGATVEQAARAATSKTEGSLRRIAVTENAEAHNSGKAAAARQLPALGLLRVWDAQLDKLTCPTCSRMDGTIVGIREPFPLGEPGTLHPWDRCTFTILHTSESSHGTLIQPSRLQVVPPPLPKSPSRVRQ